MPSRRKNDGHSGPAQTTGNPANGRSTQTNSDWEPRTWDRDATNGMNYGDHPTGDLLSTLVRSGAPPDAAKMWASELNQDHVLGKLDEAELWYRKHELD